MYLSRYSCIASQDDCQNYIRVLAKTEDGRLLVCGTNAFNPRCRFYSHNETHTNVDKEFSGKGFCPYDPRHNSTALYTSKLCLLIDLIILDNHILFTNSPNHTSNLSYALTVTSLLKLCLFCLITNIFANHTSQVEKQLARSFYSSLINWSR